MNIDEELEALLQETIKGLRKRITSDDANASDFTAVIKLLGAAGTIDALKDAKSREEREQQFSHVLDTLPDFDEDGNPTNLPLQ